MQHLLEHRNQYIKRRLSKDKDSTVHKSELMSISFTASLGYMYQSKDNTQI